MPHFNDAKDAESSSDASSDNMTDVVASNSKAHSASHGHPAAISAEASTSAVDKLLSLAEMASEQHSHSHVQSVAVKPQGVERSYSVPVVSSSSKPENLRFQERSLSVGPGASHSITPNHHSHSHFASRPYDPRWIPHPHTHTPPGIPHPSPPPIEHPHSAHTPHGMPPVGFYGSPMHRVLPSPISYHNSIDSLANSKDASTVQAMQSRSSPTSAIDETSTSPNLSHSGYDKPTPHRSYPEPYSMWATPPRPPAHHYADFAVHHPHPHHAPAASPISHRQILRDGSPHPLQVGAEAASKNTSEMSSTGIKRPAPVGSHERAQSIFKKQHRDNQISNTLNEEEVVDNSTPVMPPTARSVSVDSALGEEKGYVQQLQHSHVYPPKTASIESTPMVAGSESSKKRRVISPSSSNEGPKAEDELVTDENTVNTLHSQELQTPVRPYAHPSLAPYHRNLTPGHHPHLRGPYTGPPHHPHVYFPPVHHQYQHGPQGHGIDGPWIAPQPHGRPLYSHPRMSPHPHHRHSPYSATPYTYEIPKPVPASSPRKWVGSSASPVNQQYQSAEKSVTPTTQHKEMVQNDAASNTTVKAPSTAIPVSPISRQKHVHGNQLALAAASSDWQHQQRHKATSSTSESNTGNNTPGTCSSNRCIPLDPPIPSKYWSENDITKDVVLPDFHRLVNYPDSLNKGRLLSVDGSCKGASSKNGSGLPNALSGKKRCVMCGKYRISATYVRAKRERCNGCADNEVGNADTSTDHIIPRQNKGVCTSCDVTVWVALELDGLEIKWCKGCKNFRPWAAFGSKGTATKCVRCRDRQKEKYALQKSEQSRRRNSCIAQQQTVASNDGVTSSNANCNHHLAAVAAAKGLRNLMNAR